MPEGHEVPVEFKCLGDLWPAVTLLGEIKKCIAIDDTSGMADLLSKGIAITDMNAAIFDAKNNFHGCIAGIHEILRRQKILKGSWCLNPEESLSPGQQEEIDRVCNQYADFTDDRFVFEFLQGIDNRLIDPRPFIPDPDYVTVI